MTADAINGHLVWCGLAPALDPWVERGRVGGAPFPPASISSATYGNITLMVVQARMKRLMQQSLFGLSLIEGENYPC
jgi:hypothetical protein